MIENHLTIYVTEYTIEPLKSRKTERSFDTERCFMAFDNVVRIASGYECDHPINKVLGILKDQPDEAQHAKGNIYPDFEGIIHQMKRCGDYTDVSDIVVMVTANCPPRASAWFHAVSAPLLSKDVRVHDLKLPFRAGIILGLFKGMYYRTEEWMRWDEQTDTDFFNTIYQIIVNDLDQSDERKSIEFAETLPNGYVGTLSTAIKNVVGKGDRSADFYPLRMGQYHNFLARVAKQSPLRGEPTVVISALLTECAHATLSQWSPLAQFRIVSLGESLILKEMVLPR